MERKGLVVVVLVVLSIALFALYITTQTQLSKATKDLASASSELNTYKTKGVLYQFNPKKDYVLSTLSYQEVTGRIVDFNPQTFLLTLESTQTKEQFNLKIPAFVTGQNQAQLGQNQAQLGQNRKTSADLPPPPSKFGDLSGLSNFKKGDIVVIGGELNENGEFVIGKFVVQR